MPLAAAGQFCATSSLSQNLIACKSLVKKAVDAGARILFLPEASDYIALNASESLRLCQPVETSEFVLGLRDSAKKEGLEICVGIHEPAAPSSGGSGSGGGESTGTEDGKKVERVKNTCIYIDKSGEIAQRYQKIHLFDVNIKDGPILMESRSVEPGSTLTPPFPIPSLSSPSNTHTATPNLGMLICFDLRFPEPSLSLRRQNAHMISYPSAFTVPTGNAGHWHTLLKSRAIETQSYIIAAALVGNHNEKRRSYGHSMIVGPWGDVLGECGGIEGGGKEEICVGEIDMGVLERVRREIPLLRRFDVYPEL